MRSYQSESIAFFDLDGTLTSKDTLIEVLKFAKGRPRFYLGLVALSPVLMAYKMRLLSNQYAKEKMLAHYLKGMPVETFNALCKEFALTRLPRLFRKNALSELRRHLQNNTHVVIVSASPENWIQPWCQQFNIQCIATRLAVRDGRITGKIAGRNCHGNEKVRHILKKYNLTHYSKIYAYGDSPDDLPMLSLATESFYKPFKEQLY